MEDIIRLSLMTSRPRLLFSLIIGAIVYPLSAGLGTRGVQPLLGWDAFALTYVTIVMVTLNPAKGFKVLREHAAQEDEKRWVILVLLTIAALLSLLAIVILLNNVKSLSDNLLRLHLGLAAATIVLSWSFIHTLYAIHYVHEYYGDADARSDIFRARGGLEFPHTEEPIFSDFLYYSFVVGMTFQVSDVQVTHSRMRRLTLMQGILSFFFNTIILALSVNFAASLIS